MPHTFIFFSFNASFILSGIISIAVGTSMIPQTITNSSNLYIGNAEQYQADLRDAQLASYGFKVTVGGLVALGIGILGTVCMYCNKESQTSVVDVTPEPPQAQIRNEPKPLKSILKDTSDSELKKNIKKWLGDVKREDIV
jgi:hypothetical protein